MEISLVVFLFHTQGADTCEFNPVISIAAADSRRNFISRHQTVTSLYITRGIYSERTLYLENDTREISTELKYMYVSTRSSR